MFDIVRVNSKASDAPEQLGTKTKFWFKDDQNRRMLFKAEERGTGEDWAEKIACEICRLLGLPHVHYELAYDDGRNVPGVVCENFAARPGVLVLGNQLLLETDPSYPAEEARKYYVCQHTVEAITNCLQHLQMPSTQWLQFLPSEVSTALDVFVGYLLLDALIANQDRHHENWAAIRTPDGDHLAPTYDHGASLARNLSDQERYDRLTSGDQGRQIPRFASRARSAIYSDVSASKPLSTLEATCHFAKKSPEVALIWAEQLTRIEQAQVEHLFGRVPPQRMTQITRNFSVALVMENRQRILEALSNL